jgi:hypothetical protein
VTLAAVEVLYCRLPSQRKPPARLIRCIWGLVYTNDNKVAAVVVGLVFVAAAARSQNT